MRRALWFALAVNLLMFGVELAGGWVSRSVALLADAIDFAGDAANYGLALWVLGMAAAVRSRVALAKGWAMLAFGVVVAAQATRMLLQAGVPEAATMGAIGLVALLANLAVVSVLYAFREDDANMRAVWLCTRNDALGNVAVMLAALGVFGTSSGWPDAAVAWFMAGLAFHSGFVVVRLARAELQPVGASGHPAEQSNGQ